jgi:hypothetical protein
VSSGAEAQPELKMASLHTGPRSLLEKSSEKELEVSLDLAQKIGREIWNSKGVFILLIFVSYSRPVGFTFESWGREQT